MMSAASLPSAPAGLSACLSAGFAVPLGPGRLVRDARRRARAPDKAGACRMARQMASIFLDVPEEEIDRPSRAEAQVCRARHVAIYLAHVAFQVKLIDIARCFGRDRTSVAHAVRRIEDERDDPALDDLLGRLERLAAALAASKEGTR